MRSPLTPTSTPPVHRISGPVELLDAVPYLLGFHPRDSVVLVGLREKRLVVTARLDLADARAAGAVGQVVAAMARGGATSIIAAVYAPPAEPGPEAGERPADEPAAEVPGAGARGALSGPPPGGTPGRAPWRAFAAELRRETGRAGCELGDALLVSDGRWWSLLCEEPACCPPGGTALRPAASPFAAQATYEGLVALPDRAAVESLLAPRPAAERDRLQPLLAAEERAAVRDVLRGHGPRRERSTKRALFAAARAAAAAGDVRLSDAEAVRYGVALSVTALRDAVWLAVDAGRLDGRPLWRDLGRRLPAPYAAPPLFLYGWAAWRAGEGTQAGMAAERAIGNDPAYTAADLLMAAVTSGVNPHTVPRLRKPA